MRSYSADLRERVLADADGGLGTRAVSAKYRVSESWVRRLKQTRRATGRTAPAAQRRGPRPSWEPHADAIGAEFLDLVSHFVAPQAQRKKGLCGIYEYTDSDTTSQ